MKNLWLFIKNVLFRYDIEIAELQSIWAKVIIGLFILLGYPSATDSSYAAIRDSVPIIPFCVLLVVGGLWHSYGMVKENLYIRRQGVFLAVLVWSFMTVSMAIRQDLLALIGSTFVLSSLLVYLRLTGVLAKTDLSNDKRIPTVCGDTHIGSTGKYSEHLGSEEDKEKRG